VLYLFWKFYSASSSDPRVNHRGWKLYIRTSETDVNSGIREGVLKTPEEVEEYLTWKNSQTFKDKIIAVPKGLWESLFAP
jgi:hypothetical protein